MYKDNKLAIRPIVQDDLFPLLELSCKEDSPQWKKWDASYFEHKSLSYKDFLKKSDQLIDQEDYWGIEVYGKIIGTVSYYWEHKPSNWLEMGIVILLERRIRNKGINIMDWPSV